MSEVRFYVGRQLVTCSMLDFCSGLVLDTSATNGKRETRENRYHEEPPHASSRGAWKPHSIY